MCFNKKISWCDEWLQSSAVGLSSKMQRENTAAAWDQWASFCLSCCMTNFSFIDLPMPCCWFFFFLSPSLAGRTVTEVEVEEMLESGNPSVFTQGVSVATRCADATIIIGWLDYGWDRPSQTISSGHWSATWWYYEIREEYSRIARDVHRYGRIGSNTSRLRSTRWFSCMAVSLCDREKWSIGSNTTSCNQKTMSKLLVQIRRKQWNFKVLLGG